VGKLEIRGVVDHNFSKPADRPTSQPRSSLIIHHSSCTPSFTQKRTSRSSKGRRIPTNSFAARPTRVSRVGETIATAWPAVVRRIGAAKDVGLKLIVAPRSRPTTPRPSCCGPPIGLSYGRLSRLSHARPPPRAQGDAGSVSTTVADMRRMLAGVRGSGERRGEGTNDHRRTLPLVRQFNADQPSYPTPPSALCLSLSPLLAPLSTPTRPFWRPLFAAGGLHRGRTTRRWSARGNRSARTHIPLAAPRCALSLAPRGPHCTTWLTAVRQTDGGRGDGPSVCKRREALEIAEEMAALFRRRAAHACAARSNCEQCTFRSTSLRYEYPRVGPPGMTPSEVLAQLAYAGAERAMAARRAAEGPRPAGNRMQLIAELAYEAIFPNVWDLVQFAPARNISFARGAARPPNRPCATASASTSSIPSDGRALRAVRQPRAERGARHRCGFEHQRREEFFNIFTRNMARPCRHSAEHDRVPPPFAGPRRRQSPRAAGRDGRCDCQEYSSIRTEDGNRWLAASGRWPRVGVRLDF